MRIERLLARSAQLFGDHVAIADFARTITWAELLAESTRLARGLVASRVGPGDRVAVLAKNRIEYAELYFGCALASAVLVPLNTRLLAREVVALVERSRSRILVADARFGAELGALPEGCAGHALDADIAGWSRYEALVAGPGAELPPAGQPSDVAIQMYTSGTTGLPKGAMLTHDNVTAITTSWLLDLTLRSPADVFLQVTPLYHVGAMLMLMSCAASGARMTLLPEFAPAAVASALADGGVTHTLLVPAMIRFFLDHTAGDERPFPTLKTLVYGASPIPAVHLRRAVERFGCDLLQGYGLTETGGVLTSLRPEDHFVGGELAPAARLTSAGRPILGVEIRVVDGEMRDAPPGEVGEVVARGPNVFVGYHEMQGATAEAFRGGWFHTGDLATMDAQGFISIVDRSKDMIIVGGENVYPREVEDALRDHPLVSDVAVIGVPSETWGEAVLALVVADGEVKDEEDAIRALVWHARDRLARFKCPSNITFVPEIPRNAAGKVLKSRLRAPYWAGRDRKV
jgi:long-chain acyl-CoA synthetase